MINFSKKYTLLFLLGMFCGLGCPSPLIGSEPKLNPLKINEKKEEPLNKKPPMSNEYVERCKKIASDGKVKLQEGLFISSLTNVIETVPGLNKAKMPVEHETLVFKESDIDTFLTNLIKAFEDNKEVYEKFDNWFLNFYFPSNYSMHQRLFEKLQKVIELLDKTINETSKEWSLEQELKNDNGEIQLKEASQDTSKALREFNTAFIEKLKEVRAVYTPLWRDASASFFLRNPLTTIVSLLVVGYLFDRHFFGHRMPMGLSVAKVPLLPVTTPVHFVAPRNTVSPALLLKRP